jgi:hypothetical protein
MLLEVLAVVAINFPEPSFIIAHFCESKVNYDLGDLKRIQIRLRTTHNVQSQLGTLRNSSVDR